MSRPVRPAAIVAFVGLLSASAPIANAAPEPDPLEVTRVGAVQRELSLTGRGVTVAVLASAQDRAAMVAVLSRVAPDADLVELDSDALADVVALDRPVDLVLLGVDVDLATAEARSALADLAARGVGVIAPAGDGGRGAAASARLRPDVLVVTASAGPGIATATLDVTAPELLRARNGVHQLVDLGLPLEGRIDDATVRAWDACGGDPAPSAEGDVLLVALADCDIASVAADAATAGAAALVVGSPPGEVERWSPAPGEAPAALPVLALDGARAARLSDAAAAGATVTVDLRDGLASDDRLIDTVLQLATRGPSLLPMLHLEEPILGHGVDLAAPGASTSLAAAHVAGVAALVREAHPTWDGPTIGARLVQTAAPAWAAPDPLVSGNPSAGLGGARAPITVGGGGRVDAYQAVTGHLRARVLDAGPGAVLDLGLVRASDHVTITRTIELTNDGEAPVTAILATGFRDADDAQGGVLVSLDKSSIDLAPGASATVTATFGIDPSGLRAPTSIPASSALGAFDAVNAWAADEVDGWVRVTAGDERLAVPFWGLPRRTATTAAAAESCLAPAAFDLALDAGTGPAGRSELFTLVAAHGAGELAPLGLAAVGARTVDLPTPSLEVGAALGSAPGPLGAAVAILVDATGDGTVDRVVLAAPEHLVRPRGLAPGLATGRLASAVLAPASAGAIALPWGRFDVVDLRLAVADPIGPTWVVSASLASLGLADRAALASTRIGVAVLDLAGGALADAPVADALPAGLTPGATLASGLGVDPLCGFALDRATLTGEGRVPVVLAAAPSCDPAANATGLLALHLLDDVAHAAELVTPPSAAVYACDPIIAATADPDSCTASPDFRPHVHGACAAVATATPSVPRAFPLGSTEVELAIEDPWGHRTTCMTTLEVSDLAPPEIDCGAIDLASNMLPLDHTSAATDACGGAVAVTIVGARCLVVQGGEITFDLRDHCLFDLAGGDTIHVSDVGPVATTFEWSVSATDARGNESQETCYANVARESVGAVGGGGCAGADPAGALAAALASGLVLAYRRARRTAE